MCVTGCDLNEDFEKCPCTLKLFYSQVHQQFYISDVFKHANRADARNDFETVNEESLCIYTELIYKQQSSEVRCADGGSL